MPNVGQTIAKDPDAALFYVINWSAWLDSGETISTSEWILEAGVTKDSDSNTTTTATIKLSGGTPHQTYRVTNRITTSAGQIDDRSFFVGIQQR